jgi:hypothetical protein
VNFVGVFLFAASAVSFLPPSPGEHLNGIDADGWSLTTLEVCDSG